jgi:hypothetical protein
MRLPRLWPIKKDRRKEKDRGSEWKQYTGQKQKHGRKENDVKWIQRKDLKTF